MLHGVCYMYITVVKAWQGQGHLLQVADIYKLKDRWHNHKNIDQQVELWVGYNFCKIFLTTPICFTAIAELLSW